MLRSVLRDYSDKCNAVKRTIDFWAAAANENDKAQKDVAFKNTPPLTSCSIVAIILWHQKVCGNIIEIK